MKTATRLFALAVLLSGTFFVSSAIACSTDAWASATAGTNANDPKNDVNRLSGFCGLEVTGTGLVVDNSPTAEATFIARFYVFPKLLSAGTLFEAYSDEAGTALFKVSYDGTNINIDAADAGGGSASAAAETAKWNLIEFAWSSGEDGSLWVNADATVDPASGTFGSGTGAVEQVKLGAVSDFGSETALFDDYESHRSLPVGGLLIGDANGNGSITIADAITLFNEIGPDKILASGQPDCNISGNITIADAICLFNAL
jgi:hypothetical protein